jgi:hypothetical protein
MYLEIEGFWVRIHADNQFIINNIAYTAGILPRLPLGILAKLSLNESHCILQRAEVLGGHLFILHGDVKTFLKENHKLDDTCRIDDIAQQRLVVSQVFASAKEKVLYKKSTDFMRDVCCLHCSDCLGWLVYEL